MYIVGFAILILITTLITILFFTQPSKTAKTVEIVETQVERKDGHQGLEFKFCNQGLKNLEIWVEISPKEDLIYLFTIPPESCLFVYPKDVKYFVPGVIFFSKYAQDLEGTFVYKPYQLRDVDETIIFGEVSTDFTHTDVTRSDRNEILSLHIENRSLKPYHIFYRGDYLGRLAGYHPTKRDIEYSIHTNNNSKHFQLGTWLEFQLEGSESQFIQLRDKFTTDVHIGDVVGRTQENA